MANDYASERGIPAAPQCARSKISLRFDGQWLTMLGTLGRAYPAVSGRPTEGGKFDYSVERQKLKGVGPIPSGQYWIQPAQLWDNKWYSVFSPRSVWGDHRITIHIMPGTQSYNRGGFFIHGGTHDGTAGCINLHGQLNAFVQDIASANREVKDCYVPLTVAY